jgi:hypothetical protein
VPDSHQKVISLRFDPDLAEELETVAAVDGQSIADTVRIAVSEHIRCRKADPQFRAALAGRIRRAQQMLDERECADDQGGR